MRLLLVKDDAIVEERTWHGYDLGLLPPEVISLPREGSVYLGVQRIEEYRPSLTTRDAVVYRYERSIQ